MGYQQLILRSNRYLTAALLENRLITSDDVAKANVKLLASIQSDRARQASCLSILLFDLKTLDENRLIQFLVTNKKVGLVDLSQLDLSRNPITDIDLDLCWATMSLPFDQIGNCTCIATCYSLSKPAIEVWEARHSKVLWYTTTLRSMSNALESMEPVEKPGVSASSAPKASTPG